MAESFRFAFAYVRVPESERDLQPEIIGGEAHGEKDEGGGV
jgi:hypothetical protein